MIAVLDLPPKLALTYTRASDEAAAKRWDAELVRIECNPFWHKMFVCDHIDLLRKLVIVIGLAVMPFETTIATAV